jgi:hypothetical protein
VALRPSVREADGDGLSSSLPPAVPGEARQQLEFIVDLPLTRLAVTGVVIASALPRQSVRIGAKHDAKAQSSSCSHVAAPVRSAILHLLLLSRS